MLYFGLKTSEPEIHLFCFFSFWSFPILFHFIYTCSVLSPVQKAGHVECVRRGYVLSDIEVGILSVSLAQSSTGQRAVKLTSVCNRGHRVVMPCYDLWSN